MAQIVGEVRRVWDAVCEEGRWEYRYMFGELGGEICKTLGVEVKREVCEV